MISRTNFLPATSAGLRPALYSTTTSSTTPCPWPCAHRHVCGGAVNRPHAGPPALLLLLVALSGDAAHRRIHHAHVGSTKKLATCVAPTKCGRAYGSCRANGNRPRQQNPPTLGSGCRSDASRELFHSSHHPIAALPPPTTEKTASTTHPSALIGDADHHRLDHRGSTLHPDFRPFSESASSAGAGLKAATAEVPWWHVCNRLP